MPRRWTARELRALYARRLKGETTAALAAEVGVGHGTLRDAWRRIGLVAQAAREASYDRKPAPAKAPRWPDRGAQMLAAYTLHHAEGQTWDQVADAVAWDLSVKGLCSAVARWARKHEMRRPWRGNTPAAIAQNVAKRARRKAA